MYITLQMRLLVMLSLAQNERQTTFPLCNAAMLRCEATVTVVDDTVRRDNGNLSTTMIDLET
jgi:hypothetical protein